MIKKFFTVFAVVVCFHNYMSGQTSLTDKINEVYGEHAASLPTGYIEWINNCYSRCEILNESDVPEGINVTPLSSVPLITKYTTGLTVDENYTSDFNPLKYALNFHKKYDQYFRFGTSSIILKVHKKTI